MLSTHLFSKSIGAQVILPYQWLSTTISIVRLKSSSSSSDSSSDSESDSDTQRRRPQQHKQVSENETTEKSNTELSSLISNLVKTKPTKVADISINLRDKKGKIERQLSKVAESLTMTVGGDKELIANTLMKNLAELEKEKENKKRPKIIHSILQKVPLFNQQLDKYTKKDLKNFKLNERKIIKERLTQKKYNYESIKNAKLSEDSTYNTIREKKIIAERYGLSGKKDNYEYLMKQRKLIAERYGLEDTRNKTSVTDDKTIIAERYGLDKKRDTYEPMKDRKVIAERYGLEDTRDKTSVTDDRKIITERYGLSNKRDKSSANNERKIINRLHVKKVPEQTIKQEENESVIHALLSKHKETSKRPPQQTRTYPTIFDLTQTSSLDIPELKTWDMCEKNEFQLYENRYPENAFQEMIQWTNEGKLWKFPIDNEQGMEEESKVHFSEHVFLERHLAGWCPVKGPIRHYMELVCVGLSKNPYMTVQEKYEHIMWYKDYFDEKKDLLKELGLSNIAMIKAEEKIEPQ